MIIVIKQRFISILSMAILIALFSIIAKAETQENIRFSTGVLNQINSPTKKCETCFPQIKETKNCSYLFNLFERDQSTGLFFGMISDSPWDACKKSITQSKNISTQELESRFARDERTSLGIRSNFFTSKMNECLNGKNPKKSAADLDTQTKIIVSMGYDYLNRINQSTKQLASEVKAINNLIGEPIDKNLPCDQFNLPNDIKICSDIKNQNCKSRGELAAFSNQLYESAVEPVIALNKRLRSLRSQSYGRGGLPKYLKDEIKIIENSIILIEEQNPLIKGKSLKPFIESQTTNDSPLDKNKMQTAIKDQLIENRRALSVKISENVDMNNCLLYGDETYCKKFVDHSKRIPPHQDFMFFEKGNLTDQQKKINYATSEFYNTTQCMDNFRGLKSEFNEFATDFSVNVGLTLLSGGIGAMAKIGQGAKLALYSQRAMMAIDTGFLAAGVKEATENCSKELNKLELKSSELGTNACPVSLSTPESTVVANYQSCVTGAMLASLNGLPFVPLAVSKYRSMKTIVDDLPKDQRRLMTFKSPRKATDPFDIQSTGKLILKGEAQNAAKVFERDGVYVYIIDDKGNMVISHRAPNLNAGTKDTDQFLGTHRGLYNKLVENGSKTVVSAGEIRVIGGRPVTVSPRAGSFHNTAEDILLTMKASSPEEQKAIERLLAESKKVNKENAYHLEEYVYEHPELEATYEKVQAQLNDLAQKRLDIAKKTMEENGLIKQNSSTVFTKNISGDAHVEGKAAAIAEIECSKNKTCLGQINQLRDGASKVFNKYQTPDQTIAAMLLKTKYIEDVSKLSEKERAFNFFQRRGELLFKEGPIEFIQNARPENLGLTMDKAMKYFDDWVKQL